MAFRRYKRSYRKTGYGARYKRRTAGWKRGTRRPAYRRRRRLPQGFFKTKRCVIDNNATMTTNANGFGLSTFQFKMNDLPDYSEYTELWKWYRIVGIKVEMTPMWGHGAWDENNQVSPTIYSMVHRKNTTLSAPTSLSDLDQVGKLRTHYCAPGKTWSMYFVPNSYMDEGLQAATHGYTPGFKKWIPTQDPTYVHSGCAIYIAGGGAKTYHFQRKRTFYLELKETK